MNTRLTILTRHQRQRSQDHRVTDLPGGNLISHEPNDRLMVLQRHPTKHLRLSTYFQIQPDRPQSDVEPELLRQAVFDPYLRKILLRILGQVHFAAGIVDVRR